MRILAIDFNSLFARNWHASSGAERGEAYQRTIEWVQKARDGYDRVALCCDSGQKSYRVGLWQRVQALTGYAAETCREWCRACGFEPGETWAKGVNDGEY